MPRLAWFSPLPPVRSGIATYCSELLPALAAEHEITVFVDAAPAAFESPHLRIRLSDAHDFVWKHRSSPYDLIVYQLGNAPCHDYMWAYMIRFPGLVVLHDGQLHHARGRMLLQRRYPRRNDYRTEFRFNHPDAHPDVAELGAVGLLGSLTQLWPMLRIVAESSRSVIVHNDWLADEIRESHPGVAVDVVEMGVPEPIASPDARRRIRVRHGIAEEAVVFTSIGKVTPEKRLREAMRALAAIGDVVPRAHLLIAGEAVDYYDLESEAATLGIRGRVFFAGYARDHEVADYLAASDVGLCMRWPTSRETSASWLRCLAAGTPTISTDLVHTVDIPALDPRNWSLLTAGAATDSGETVPERQPVGVTIDILDEDHSLKLALRRLSIDEKLRGMLASNARKLWAARFNLERMVDGYLNVIGKLLQPDTRLPDSGTALPLHLRATGAEHAEALVTEILGRDYHLRDAD